MIQLYFIFEILVWLASKGDRQHPLGGSHRRFCPSFLQVGLLCPLFCWVVLLCLFILWMVFWVGLLFPCLLLGGAAWPPSLSAVAFYTLLLRGAAFLLLLWVVLLSPLLLFGCCFASSSFGRCCVFPLLLRGAAFLPLLP